MINCTICRHCYFVLGSAYCNSTKLRATKISDKQLYNKKGYCSGFEEKEEKEEVKGGADMRGGGRE